MAMHLGQYLGALCNVYMYVRPQSDFSQRIDWSWTATIYWAHIGRIIYAASNEQLAILTGPGNKENFTMKWHCREVLEGPQKDIEIIGPVKGMDLIVMMEADQYWSKTRS